MVELHEQVSSVPLASAVETGIVEGLKMERKTGGWRG